MALTPQNEAHALQIQAGVLGRKAGHSFEEQIAAAINGCTYPFRIAEVANTHVLRGDPSLLLLQYLGKHHRVDSITQAVALSTGTLATSEAGKQWLSVNGVHVTRCKSDIVVTLSTSDGRTITAGVSTKQCNNAAPTNAQLFFTTARAFAALLRNNGIDVSDNAVDALRQFCGDFGFRPLDNAQRMAGRMVDPRRYFWEEIDRQGRDEWERILTNQQDVVSRLLLQKAYLDDPFVPDFLIHKTKCCDAWANTEVAIYAIEELINLSRAYQGFCTRPYTVRKGSYRDPAGVSHLAPRFGVIQMQRGGQAQHPEQLQFNLEASYFYKLR